MESHLTDPKSFFDDLSPDRCRSSQDLKIRQRFIMKEGGGQGGIWSQTGYRYAFVRQLDQSEGILEFRVGTRT